MPLAATRRSSTAGAAAATAPATPRRAAAMDRKEKMREWQAEKQQAKAPAAATTTRSVSAARASTTATTRSGGLAASRSTNVLADAAGSRTPGASTKRKSCSTLFRTTSMPGKENGIGEVMQVESDAEPRSSLSSTEQSPRALRTKSGKRVRIAEPEPVTEPEPSEAPIAAEGSEESAWTQEIDPGDGRKSMVPPLKIVYLEKELQHVHDKLQEQTKAVTVLQAQLQQVQTTLQETQEKLQQQSDKSAALEAEKTELQHTRDDLTRRLQETKLEMEMTKLNLAELQTNFESERISQDAKLRSLRAELEAMQAAKALAEAKAAEADDESARLREQNSSLRAERQALQNENLNLKGNIRVFCRVRPAQPHESKDDAAQTFYFPRASVDCKTLVLCEEKAAGVDGTIREGRKTEFTFDRTQSGIFEQVRGVVDNMVDGHRVCIFAYGQTGAGKTYTMEGPASVAGTDLHHEQAGLIPRSVKQVFTRVAELQEEGWTVSLEAQFVEIYNETLRDLLSRGSAKIDIHHSGDRTTVSNAASTAVESADQVFELLRIAHSNRTTAKTACNDRSSRSHSVFMLHMNARHARTNEDRYGVLNLVDLAGSERLKNSHATDETLKETQSINSSLSTLSKVIESLRRKQSHVAFRDSKLTYLLSKCMGGDCKALMICNLSPLAEHAGESLCSLRFAEKVNACTTNSK